MKAVLALFVFVAFAWANSTPYYAWAPQKQYTFRFESDILTAIPAIQSQWAGMRLLANVIVQSQSDYTLNIRFVNSHFITVNDKIHWEDNRAVIPSQGAEEVPSHLKKSLEAPFSVHHKRGVIESFFVEKDEPEMVSNIKKAVLAQLQLDLSGSRSNDMNIGTLGADNQLEGGRNFSDGLSYFSTEESTLLGDCLTTYTIHPLPSYQAKELESKWEVEERKLKHERQIFGKESHGESECRGKQYYEITKTKNLDKCKQRPVYQQWQGVVGNCDTSRSSCKDTFTQISASKYFVCGSRNNFYIRQSYTDNTIVTEPLGWNTNEKLRFSSRISLTLLDVEESFQPMRKPEDAKEKRSLIFEYPSKNLLSAHSQQLPLAEQKSVENEIESDFGMLRPIHKMPDMKSAPQMFLPGLLTKEEITEQVSKQFEKLHQNMWKSPESCASNSDVAGTVISIARALRYLSFDELKEVEREAISSGSSSADESHGLKKKLFSDILAMVGTNPSVLLVKKQIQNGELHGEEAVEVLQSTIHNVKTPTKELFVELLELLKNERSKEQLFGTGIMSLSDLVYRACIDPSTVVSNYPVKIYGEFCNPKSEFIVRELIPFLEKELEESMHKREHDRIIMITALGKLGHKATLKSLLSVAEGTTTGKAMTRSLAVHYLKRLAKRQPSIIRPLLLTLIDNMAENPQVRMAAVSILPWTQPSTAELQKIAVRSWFEPSNQVSSYIYSTLSSLKHTKVPELMPVGLQARNLLKLMKPIQTGVQFSQNYHIGKLVEYLELVVSQKFDVVSSPESIIPSKLSFSSDIFAGAYRTEGMEFSVISRGIDELLNKALSFINRESELSQSVKDELKKIDEALNIETRDSTDLPEVHMQLRLLGLERIVSLDKEFYMKTLERITEQLKYKPDGLINKDSSFKVMKLIKFAETQSMGPSVSGLPVLMERSVPVVLSAKGSIKTSGGKRIDNDLAAYLPSEITAKFVPVLNVKIQSRMGVICPFTKQFLGAGVDVSLHSSTPLETRITWNKHGQIDFKVKAPESIEKEIELIHVNIKPYTVMKNLNTIMPSSQSPSAKLIHASEALKKYNVELGRSIGIDAELSVATDHRYYDLASYWEKLRQHNVMSFLQLGLLVPSVRAHSFKITFNPKKSETKEFETSISLAQAKKAHEQEPIAIRFPTRQINKEEELKKVCEEVHESQAEIEQCIQVAGRKLEEQEVSEKNRAFCDEQIEGNKKEEEEKKENKHRCLKTAKICQQVKHVCLQGQLTEKECRGMEWSCKMRHRNVHKVESLLGEFADGSALSINIEAAINSQSDRKSVSTTVTAGKQRRGSEIKTLVIVDTKTPYGNIYEVVVSGKTIVPKLAARWNKEALLDQDLKLVNDIKISYGRKHGDKQEIEIKSTLSKTESQKESVRKSHEYEMCNKEESKGLKLSPICMKVRHEAASIDKLEMIVRVPEQIARCPHLKEMESLFQTYFVTQLRLVKSESSTIDPLELHIVAEVSREGDEAQLKIKRTGLEMKIKDIRLPWTVKKIFPFSLRTTMSSRLVQKLTSNQAPASCRIEPTLIRTFDNSTYDYSVNDCEHLLVKDCSSTSAYAVTVRGSGANKIVKLVSGKHFVELKSRGAKLVSVFVNGEEKHVPSGQILSEKTSAYEQLLQVERYPDEVISVRCASANIEVVFDGERIEVLAPQSLHNRACGLCGDLNGEETADLKSPRKCLFRKPQYIAYSYMLENKSCEGVPRHDREDYESEKRTCVKQREIKTPLLRVAKESLAEEQSLRGLIHKVEEQSTQVCISKKPVRVCGRHYEPVYAAAVELQFTCLSKPSSKAQQLEIRAKAGELLPELMSLHTHYRNTVYEPVACVKIANDEMINYRNSPRN